MQTAKTAVVQFLKECHPQKIAVHEFHIVGYSENNLATRLSELAQAGVVEGTYRPGKRFKEWGLLTYSEPCVRI